MNTSFCNGKKFEKVFSKNDYNSDNGFSTFIWGPSLWNFLHIMSFNYPIKPTKEDKEHYMMFIKSLQYILPCKSCRENFIKNVNFRELKKALKNRELLSKWFNKLHNIINKQLGKKTNILYDESRDFYEQFRARCQKTKGKKHGGCNEPYHKGIKSRTVLRIIPRNSKVPTLDINKKCLSIKNKLS